MPNVSIPFKRESLSKVALREERLWLGMHRFQFPSNGKAYPKDTKSRAECLLTPCVSIPFKRESLSKGMYLEIFAVGNLCVSIPFKRESLSKVREVSTFWIEKKSFNSLPTGKPIQRQLPKANRGPCGHFVSIPFNRESLSKAIGGFGALGARHQVSIPFNRESLSKVKRKVGKPKGRFVSIPFNRESLSKGGNL